MAVVILEPISATLHPAAGKAQFWQRDQGAMLVMKAKMPHHAGIWLQNDERSFAGDITLSIRAAPPEAIEAILKLSEGLDEPLETGDVVGSMRFSGARKATGERIGHPAEITFEAFVPAKYMSSIVGLAKGGRFPMKVWLDVRGLGYRDFSRRRDASFLWPQHTERPELPITDVSFEFPHHRQTDFQLVHAEPDGKDGATPDKPSPRALNLLEPFWIRVSVRFFWLIWIVLAVVIGLGFWILH
ncbi:MAG TPA: hypothetical protein VG227_07855 [Caulobacteraceae bacterium]|jgi:hypothetical protein|nr:hypothetical protein [Caulobacteraceae bacterium]